MEKMKEKGPGEYVKVAKVDQLTPGNGIVVDFDGEKVALFNCDGEFYALSNTCLHKGGPLGEGKLDGRTVTCPWHGWQYDISTGINKKRPDKIVANYKVKVEKGEVLISK